MSLATYLVQRGKRGTWQLRVPVPRALHAPGKPKERVKSMGTTDRRIASDRALAVLDSWKREWAQALSGASATLVSPSRARKKPTDDELKEAAVAVAHDLYLANADAHRRGLWSLGRWAHDIAVDNARVEAGDRAYAQAAGIHTDAQNDVEVVSEILDFDMSAGSAEYERLSKLITEVRASSALLDARRAEGYFDVETDSPIVQEVKAREAARAKPGETITELFEVYLAKRLEAKTKRPAGADQDRMVLDVFAEFVGRDRSIALISAEDAQEFVDALAKVPSGYKKRGDYRGMTVRQAIVRAEAHGHKPISLITQQRYISTVSPFFRWLQSAESGRRIRRNPFEGLHLDTSKIKGANTRPPFTADQISKIINSPLFTGFLADGKEHVAGNQRADDWRYWLPLICLFTGARIGEVAQLWVDDMFRDHGVWCVKFRHDEATGQRTKSDKSRTVALHSELLSIGLLAFVQKQKTRAEKDGNRQLFPKLDRGKREQFGDMPSAWWRDYLTRIGIKPRDGGGFGSHSFRHTMADQLRVAGHLDHEFGPLIFGHSTTSVTGGYGRAKQGTPQLSQSIIESARFVPIEDGRLVEGGEPVNFQHLLAG
ncbi:hypothetical protein NS277_13490 [Novosphingobium barchaimii]|nr:hypothetical protein NS277_13490 [Novosphingobium barchaimii]